MTDFANDPAEFFGNRGYAAQHMAPEDISAHQLDGLKERFASLRDRLPVLKMMADEAGIETLETLDSVVPLLFAHSIYKSYPLSLLEKNRFDLITKWLARLTTHDLTSVREQSFESIDDWLAALDSETELRPAHSSGTSGALSFLPRARLECEVSAKLQKMNLFEFVDPDGVHDHSNDTMHVIWPTFAHGRSGTHRAAAFYRDVIAGTPDHFHPLHPTSMSADMMFLASRVRRAQARGEIDTIVISPTLKARRGEFEAMQKSLPEALDKLFDHLLETLRGEKVLLIGQTVAIHDFAINGLARGLENVFAPGSIVQTGGGMKGQTLPADWEDTVARFTGVPRVALTYGMTELSMTSYRCELGRYHISPWIIPFVLEPETGAPLPREGTQKGRGAFFDLVPQSYWGGFVSGDEVEIDWQPCACGRTTPHLHSHVERFSEKQGGDDKITCAAAEDAHTAALDVLTGELI